MLEWNDKKLIAQVGTVTDRICQEGAEMIAQDMRRGVPVKTGELKDTIQVRKSKFKDGGYIAGVFSDDSAKWEETLGARAIFVEYGHASPSRGRSNVKRNNITKTVPAKPFIRPALRKNRRKIAKRFEGALR